MGYKNNSRQLERWTAMERKSKHPMSPCHCRKEEEEAEVSRSKGNF